VHCLPGIRATILRVQDFVQGSDRATALCGHQKDLQREFALVHTVGPSVEDGGMPADANRTRPGDGPVELLAQGWEEQEALAAVAHRFGR
jgi:hypothetical protein